ncbi:MAG: hypothetical protein AAFP76_05920 [Bacteroidota bacterium]
MGYNLQALNYCGTHPNTFLKQNCKHCGQGMCTDCIEKHPHFCPECQIELGMVGTTRNAKRETIFMTLTGMITGGLFAAFAYFLTDSLMEHSFYYGFLAVAFLVGVSFVGTYYFLRDKNFVSDLWNLPLNGAKLSIYAIVLVFISCIPIGYYFYQLFTFIFRTITGKKE